MLSNPRYRASTNVVKYVATGAVIYYGANAAIDKLSMFLILQNLVRMGCIDVKSLLDTGKINYIDYQRYLNMITKAKI